MDKARKQRLVGLLGLFLLSCAYVAWTERPRILVHYSPTATQSVHYSYKENDEEKRVGDIQPGAVMEYPVTLGAWFRDEHRISFHFNRGKSQFASFTMQPGWGKVDLYLSPSLVISTEPTPPGLLLEEFPASEADDS